MGNLSPLNQSKLKEVLNYLTTNNSDQRAKSTGKKNRETNASFYGIFNFYLTINKQHKTHKDNPLHHRILTLIENH